MDGGRPQAHAMATRDTPEAAHTHEAHLLLRLERGRDLTDTEIACMIADHQTTLRHGTADPEVEALEMYRDRLRHLAAIAHPLASGIYAVGETK